MRGGIDPTRQAADDGVVVTEGAVTSQRRELVEQALHVVEEVRPARMARDLDLLPGRQLGVGVADEGVGAILEPDDLRLDLHRRVFLGELLQLNDLAFDLGNRTLEFQIGVHGDSRFGGRRILAV